MNKLKQALFAVFAFMFATSFVNAVNTCGVSETASLNKEVVNIKASFEEAEGELDPNDYPMPDSLIGTPEAENYKPTYNYFKITVINLTENFYIEVTNDYNSETRSFYYSDSDNGVITFDWEDISAVVNFTIKVYASNKTGCAGDSYGTLYVTTPRVNEYYNYTMCDRIPDYYLCQKYVTFSEDIEFSTFVDKVDKYIKEKDVNNTNEEENKKLFEKVGDFIVEHKVVFITSGVILLVGAGVAVAVIIKRRRSSAI